MQRLQPRFRIGVIGHVIDQHVAAPRLLLKIGGGEPPTPKHREIRCTGGDIHVEVQGLSTFVKRCCGGVAVEQSHQRPEQRNRLKEQMVAFSRVRQAVGLSQNPFQHLTWRGQSRAPDCVLGHRGQ